jgi:hypothetical protein
MTASFGITDPTIRAQLISLRPAVIPGRAFRRKCVGNQIPEETSWQPR